MSQSKAAQRKPSHRLKCRIQDSGWQKANASRHPRSCQADRDHRIQQYSWRHTRRVAKGKPKSTRTKDPSSSQVETSRDSENGQHVDRSQRPGSEGAHYRVVAQVHRQVICSEKMDVLKAVQVYINKAITVTSGIKVLLLDSETTPIVSLAATTSHLLAHEVYLTDRIDNPKRESMKHLKCLILVRPTPESLDAVQAELARPRYGSYYLFFTNILKKSDVERLAAADESELVQEVQEYFADYSAITSSHLSLDCLPAPLSLYEMTKRHRLFAELPTTWDTSDTGSFDRHVEGLTSLLLSLKKKPVIRYERMSPMAKKLGQDLSYQMSAESQLFDFRPTSVPPLLLLLDRRNDPVTPLLTQWTYQAMVHELIGINNGRVSLRSAPDISDDLKDIVLSPEQDPFFAKTLYDNFGDLGAHVKDYVSDYQTRSNASGFKKIDTVSDMKRFVDEYPEFRKLGGNVSKHVALVGELSRLVESTRLLEISELEQSLATQENHHNDLRTLQNLILATDVSSVAKLRISILYALRYQKMAGNAISDIVKMLEQNGVDPEDASLVTVMLNFAGADQRQDDLFANENFFSRGRSALKGLRGVDNVYTQHTPHLAETLSNAIKGRLKDTSYPYIENHAISPHQLQAGQRPQDVIVFMIGGTTFEEARTVALMNQQSGTSGASSPYGPMQAGGAGTHIVLGGTGVLNSRSFLAMVKDAATRFPQTISSSALALKPTTYDQRTASTANSLGQLNLNNRTPGQVEANVSQAARGIFNKVRQGVDMF